MFIAVVENEDLVRSPCDCHVTAFAHTVHGLFQDKSALVNCMSRHLNCQKLMDKEIRDQLPDGYSFQTTCRPLKSGQVENKFLGRTLFLFSGL